MILASIFAPNSVYIMRPTSLKYAGKRKIGVSNAPWLRAQSVSKSIKGDAVVSFQIKVFFAYQVEGLLHFLFRPIHTKMEGSGKTEWFKPALPLWLAFAVCFALVYRFGNIDTEHIRQMKKEAIAPALLVSGIGAVVLNSLTNLFFLILAWVLLIAIRLIQEAVIIGVVYMLIKKFA